MSEYPSYLIHYGIEGQKCGVRRFQNEDGTYTSDGLERRRKLEDIGASKKIIREAKREGKRELKYNKQLAKEQAKIGKKFDKKTEKILRDQEKGKQISKRRIDKAIDLGTKYRVSDYIAKDPKAYYEIKEVDRKIRNSQAASMLAFPVMSSTIGFGVIDLSHINVNKAIKQAYQHAYDLACNETIADLEKHGIKGGHK